MKSVFVWSGTQWWKCCVTLMKVDAFGFSKAVFTEVGKLIVIEVRRGHIS